MTNEQAIAQIWADLTDTKAEAVTLSTSLRDSVDDFDSLDLAEFFMTVEERFDVELPDRICVAMRTIGDVVVEVAKALAAKMCPSCKVRADEFWKRGSVCGKGGCPWGGDF